MHSNLQILTLGFSIIFSAVSARVGVQQRDDCNYDEALLGFEYSSPDSQKSCRSLLSISDQTTTLPATTSTWTITNGYTTIYDRPDYTITVPKATTITTIKTTIGQIGRRDDGPIAPQTTGSSKPPYFAQFDAPGAASNSVLATNVYKDCSCLHLEPLTITTRPIITATEAVTGTKHAPQPEVTQGTKTFTVTQRVLPSPVSSLEKRTTDVPVSFALTGFLTAVATSDSSATDIPTAVATSDISAIDNPTEVATTDVSEIDIPTAIPTSDISAIDTLPAVANSPISATSYPTAFPTSDTHAPFTNTTSPYPQNTTSPSTTPLSLTSCPTINSTLHTDTSTLHNTYQILCYLTYPPSGYLDFHAASFEACMVQCSYIGLESKCYGVSWLGLDGKLGGAGVVNCYLNMARREGVPGVSGDEGVVSAMLIGGK